MFVLFALLLGAAPAPSGKVAFGANAEPMIADCDAHKFETIARVMVDGKMRGSRVKLCGKVGETDAGWLRTLKDAIRKIAASATMSAEAKDQVIAALNIEIVRLSPVRDANPPQTAVLIPSPEPAPTIAVPVNSGPSVGGSAEYSVLPPLPAPKLAASGVVHVAAAPALPAPRVTFRCQATSGLGVEGPCNLLERDTVLMIQADEDIPGGTSLRFLRRGDDRGEIDLPVLRSGQSRRFNLPAKLCAGVARSRVEIQIVRAATGTTQVVDTRGPFELRC
jgi:hypothetical protein